MPVDEKTSVKERKKLDLKIKIKDFGPISSGEIALKPLTILIGPNNSGKSYAAKLIHSIFEIYKQRDIPGVLSAFEISGVHFPLSKKQFDVLKEGEKSYIPEKSLEPTNNFYLEWLFQEVLRDRIARSFSCKLSELVRAPRDSFGLSISYGSSGVDLESQDDGLKIKRYPEIGGTLEVESDQGYKIRYIDEEDQEQSHTGISGSLSGASFQPVLLIALTKIIDDVLLKKVVIQCHYLPAGRSGITQVSTGLVANVFSRSTDASIEKPQIPKLPGPISDLVLSSIEIPEEEGPLYQLAQDFERELLGGEIVVRRPEEYSLPQIKYRFQDTDIPLSRASSTVSELAPLFLYLKYRIKPGSVLIIEEPEAHLHPANQRILARLLVRLVREGVNVIITTHSDYLLEQIRNFTLLSKIEPEKRIDKYKYEKEDFLEPDELAAYTFQYDKENEGYKIDEVEVNEDDGITQEEFVKVIDALYEETIRLRRDLSDQE